MSTIDVTYDLTCPATEVDAFAAAIALEQTVEVPEAVVAAAHLPPGIVGEVGPIRPLPGTPPRFRVRIRYATDLSAFQLPQLLNLLYGNISIKNKIHIVDVSLPDELLARFRGPAWGLDGVRARLGVYDRPLLATALKPRGATVEHLAGIARDFVLGGGDLVKDDHNLVDADFAAFAARVRRCHAAVQEASRSTGRPALYLPNLLPPAEALDRHVALLRELGVPGVLVCPFISGLDTVRRLAERSGLIIMAHPAFSGTFFHDPDHGITPALLLGRLLRLAGADLSVFPNHGGRFAFTRDQCAALSRALLEPLGTLRPAGPVPAGGMRLDSIPQMAELYGADAVYLIGGALLSHSDSLRASTATFVERVAAHFTPRYETPQAAPPDAGLASACELPAAAAPALRNLLRYQGDFTWSDRPPTAYKASAELPFRDVRRVELLGRAGENTAFELRYFEIAPGGYSSCECHGHTHAIVALRGRGVLVMNDERSALAPYDVAYVPPDAVHQLRNEGDAPFGFLCIVDRDRDRPRAPA